MSTRGKRSTGVIISMYLAPREQTPSPTTQLLPASPLMPAASSSHHAQDSAATLELLVKEGPNQQNAIVLEM